MNDPRETYPGPWVYMTKADYDQMLAELASLRIARQVVVSDLLAAIKLDPLNETRDVLDLLCDALEIAQVEYPQATPRAHPG